MALARYQNQMQRVYTSPSGDERYEIRNHAAPSENQTSRAVFCDSGRRHGGSRKSRSLFRFAADKPTGGLRIDSRSGNRPNGRATKASSVSQTALRHPRIRTQDKEFLFLVAAAAAGRGLEGGETQRGRMQEEKKARVTKRLFTRLLAMVCIASALPTCQIQISLAHAARNKQE